MADNQITPFQLTDQFTMDNFNQRINETNTALQNKAPAGYGLGTSAAVLPSTNLDSITYNGWYVIGSTSGLTNPPPFGWGVLHVYSRNSSNVVQEVVGADKKARRYCADGTWQPWEWVNPPMILGEEYRTTERYNGKPVYAKAVSVGDISANTLVVANSFSNGGEAVVRCYAIAKYASAIVTSPQNSLFNCTLVANGFIYTTSNNQVRVYIKSDSNMTDCVAVAYYTKA